MAQPLVAIAYLPGQTSEGSLLNYATSLYCPRPQSNVLSASRRTGAVSRLDPQNAQRGFVDMVAMARIR
jgi:hypothetical protein